MLLLDVVEKLFIVLAVAPPFLRRATAAPVPNGVDVLTILLFLRTIVEVVEVLLEAWNIPDEPKFVPPVVEFK